MTIQISAYRWVPPFAQGYVRDLWVRWALEEAGLAYEVVLIDAAVQGSADYRAWQPFGLVPAYRDDEVELFESGAIVLHLATRSEGLAPRDAAGRARVSAWGLAAQTTIHGPIQSFLSLEPDSAGAAEGRARTEAALRSRLGALSAWLGDKSYLEGRFSAADLMMTGVLRELVDSGVLASYSNLDQLRGRCEARPAFQRALQAQMKVFDDNTPT